MAGGTKGTCQAMGLRRFCHREATAKKLPPVQRQEETVQTPSTIILCQTKFCQRQLIQDPGKWEAAWLSLPLQQRAELKKGKESSQHA